MIRIFLPLSVLSTILLVVTLVLGFQIDDPRIPDPAVQRTVGQHFLTALGSLCFATLVHAIVLTYFMGTGRWLEETSNAYRLPADFYNESQALKYRVVPAIVGCFLLLLTTGALGAAGDPGSPVQFQGWLGWPAATWHRTAAVTTLVVNVLAHYYEYVALFRNGEIVENVLREVRRIRQEKGLAVD